MQKSVLVALSRMTGPVTEDELSVLLRDELQVRLRAVEMARVLAELVQNGQAVEGPDGRYRLSTESRLVIVSEISDQAELVERIERRFVELLAVRLPDVDPHRTYRLFLDEYLIPMITDLGVLTYRLFEDSSVTVRLHEPSVRNLLSRFAAAQREPLREVLAIFLDPANVDVRAFVLRLLYAYFLVESSALSRTIIDRIYKDQDDPIHLQLLLDTALFNSYLKLSSGGPSEAISELLQPGGGLQFGVLEMYLRPETLQETKHDILTFERRLTDVLAFRRASAASEARQRALLTKYKESQDAGWVGTPREYFRYVKSTLRALADARGIQLLRRPPGDQVLREPAVQRDLDRIVEDDLPPDLDRKTREEWEHDVLLWHTVETFRDVATETFLEAGWWLLTDDPELLAFDIQKQGGMDSQAVCLHPTALLQVLQFLVPRFELLEQSIVGVLRGPLLLPPNEAYALGLSDVIASAMRRIDELGLGESEVARALLDELMRERALLKGEEASQVELAVSRLQDRERKVKHQFEITQERLRELVHSTDRSPTDKDLEMGRILDEAARTVINVSASSVTVPLYQGVGDQRVEQNVDAESVRLLREFMSQFAVALAAQPVDDDVAKDALAELATMEAQLGRVKPNRRVLAESIATLRSIAESFAGSAAFAGVAALGSQLNL